MGIYAVIVLHALFAWTVIINKKLAVLAHPVFITTLQLLITGGFLLIYTVWKKQNKITPLIGHAALFGLVAITSYMRHLLKYWGLLYIPATKASIIFTATPCFIAIFSQLALKKGPTSLQWRALIITCLGMLPVLCAHTPLEELSGYFLRFTLPDMALFSAMLLYSCGAVAMQTLITKHQYPSWFVYTVCSLSGGMLGIGSLYLNPDTLVIDDMATFIGWFIVLIIISKLICSILYYRLFHYYSATFISLSESISPLFVSLYSSTFLGEVPSWYFASSFIIMTSGILLFYRDELRFQRKKLEPII